MAGPFSYRDSTATIGASIGRALFGDPEAARALAESKAKMDALAAQAEQDRAHATLYGTQTDDQRMRTDCRGSFDDLAHSLPHPQPARAPDTPSTALLRRSAKISIGKGADPDAVAKRFKELTGEDL